jgi:2-oxoglutarate ferredoxin oxidoreductase subunit alpha
MNHEQMIRTRGRKIAGITREIPKTEIFGAERGDLLVLGWGGTYGALREAVRQLHGQGHAVGHVHLRYLNPMPADLGDVLRRFRRVVVPEINLGQLVKLVRADYLVDAIGFNQVQGRPFKVSELVGRCLKLLKGSTEEAA